MSQRDTNILHYRTPYKLLRIPEYTRWFDATTIGAFYRLLSSRIFRRKTQDLKYFKEGGYVTELSKLYTDNKLCSYFTDDELREALCFEADRSVRNIRSQLIELKLIKAKPFGDGWIYELGIVVTLRDSDGYEIGKENEAHYFDRWYSYADVDENSEEMYAFRYYLASMLASAGKKETILAELGKTFPEIGKNFSKKLNLPKDVEAAARQQIPAVLRAPIEVKEEKSISTKVDGEKVISPTDTHIFEDAVKEEARVILEESVRQFYGRLKRNYPLSDMSKDYRKVIDLGADKKLLNEAILKSVHEKNRFSKYPLFSKALDTNFKDEATGALRIWSSLREDVLGVTVSQGSKTYTTNLSVMRVILKKYSLEQVLWTMKYASGTHQVSFMCEGTAALDKVIGNLAAIYLQWKENRRVEEAKKQQQEAWSATSQEEKEKYYSQFKEEIIVPEIKNVVKVDENEKHDAAYWEGLAATPGIKLSTKMKYEQKAYEAKLLEEALND
jgi:hypothetical protein